MKREVDLENAPTELSFDVGPRPVSRQEVTPSQADSLKTTVELSAVCGALALMLVAASNSLWQREYITSGLLLGVSTALVSLGYFGTKRRSEVCVALYSGLCFLCCAFSFLQIFAALIGIIGLFSESKGVVNEQTRRHYGTQIGLHVMQALFFLASTGFWAISGWTSYRLAKYGSLLSEAA